MNIIYVSSLCSDNKFYKLFDDYSKMPGQQYQKYHKLLIEGFKANSCTINMVSGIPVTSKNHRKRYFKAESENINNVAYHYVALINFPIIKNIFVVLGSIVECIKISASNKKCTVIVDVLSISSAIGALIASKVLKLRSVGIVTDIPNFLSKDPNKLSVKINNMIMNKFDSYVFLTKEMSKVVNCKDKTFIVVEGHVDINMHDVGNKLEDKHSELVCMYAGITQKKYGIQYLTEAFLKANVPNAELHIYGRGDFEEELKRISNIHSQIKYFGVKPNDYIVKQEMKATLLINPRPTDEEYTKYSFPSKNMEYMVSGTPVLTTKLPGMPEEYNDYVYLIDEETVEGLSTMLKNLLSKSREELYAKGLEAKEFVLRKKNNVVQARKIMDILEKGK